MNTWRVAGTFIALAAISLAIVYAMSTTPAGSGSFMGQRQYLNEELIAYSKSFPNAASVMVLPQAQMSSSYGITETIDYEGRPAFKSKSPSYAYCSGLMFQAFMHCRRDANPSPDYLGIGRANVFEFRRMFYGTDGNQKTLVNAITHYGLGEEIPSIRDARPGDLVQFWRNNGTGHSVLYTGCTITTDGKPYSLKYWSMQRAGLKESEELIGSERGEIDPNRIYIVRAYAR